MTVCSYCHTYIDGDRVSHENTCQLLLDPDATPKGTEAAIWATMVQSLVQECRRLGARCHELETRVNVLEQERPHLPPAPRQQVSRYIRMLQMQAASGSRGTGDVVMPACTVPFRAWVSLGGAPNCCAVSGATHGFEPHVDLNVYFTYGFADGLLRTVETRIRHDKARLPPAEFPFRVMTCTSGSGSDRIDRATSGLLVYDEDQWKDAHPDVIDQIFDYAVFDTERAFHAWDVEHGDDIAPDKYAAYAVNISGRHAGIPKLKHELRRKLVEWCK